MGLPGCPYSALVMCALARLACLVSASCTRWRSSVFGVGGREAGLLPRGSHRVRRSVQVVLGLCGVRRHFCVGGADSLSCSRLWGSWSRKGWWGCAYSGVINWRGFTSWHDSRLGVVLASHDVKTVYVGSMCGTLVARRSETDIAGIYVFNSEIGNATCRWSSG
jgi:hypothetical protein